MPVRIEPIDVEPHFAPRDGIGIYHRHEQKDIFRPQPCGGGIVGEGKTQRTLQNARGVRLPRMLARLHPDHLLRRIRLRRVGDAHQVKRPPQDRVSDYFDPRVRAATGVLHQRQGLPRGVERDVGQPKTIGAGRQSEAEFLSLGVPLGLRHVRPSLPVRAHDGPVPRSGPGDHRPIIVFPVEAGDAHRHGPPRELIETHRPPGGLTIAPPGILLAARTDPELGFAENLDQPDRGALECRIEKDRTRRRCRRGSKAQGEDDKQEQRGEPLHELSESHEAVDGEPFLPLPAAAPDL